MQYNMVLTTERVQATLFIVEDATAIPERARWAAALTGGWVVEVSCLEKRTGLVVKLQRAIRTQKKNLFDWWLQKSSSGTCGADPREHSTSQTQEWVENYYRAAEGRYCSVFITGCGWSDESGTKGLCEGSVYVTYREIWYGPLWQGSGGTLTQIGVAFKEKKLWGCDSDGAVWLTFLMFVIDHVVI